MGAVPNLGMICAIHLLISTRMLWAAPYQHRPHLFLLRLQFLSLR
jgi:hypothetical protein